jgi:hypothetical protein
MTDKKLAVLLDQLGSPQFKERCRMVRNLIDDGCDLMPPEIAERLGLPEPLALICA